MNDNDGLDARLQQLYRQHPFPTYSTSFSDLL